MGLTVERTIVIGIFVVIVAILGIAISGAMDPDSSPFGVRESDDATAKAASEGNGSAVIIDKRVEAARRQQEREKRRADALDHMMGSNKREIAKGPTNVPPIAGGPGAQGSSGSAIPLRKEAVKKDVTPEDEPKKTPKDDPQGGSRPGAGPVMIEYVVETGDSLWKIARKHYGDGDIKRIVDIILAANPTIDGDHIKAGETVLQLPAELPSNVQTPPVLKKTTKDTTPKSSDKKKPLNSTAKVPKYEVQGGDSLRLIAKRQLGDEDRWNEIYELNRAYIEAPEKIHPGMTLLMPSH